MDIIRIALFWKVEQRNQTFAFCWSCSC